MHEIYTPRQLFLLGLIIGRTHGQVELQSILENIDALEYLRNPDEKFRLQASLLASNSQEQQTQLIHQMQLEEKNEDHEAQMKLVKKEVLQLSTKFSQMGCQDACPNYELIERVQVEKQQLLQSQAQMRQTIKHLQDQIQALKGQKQELPQIPVAPPIQEFKDEELARKLQEEINKQEEEKKRKEEEVESSCHICFESLFTNSIKNQKIYTMPECKHVMHEECLQDYLIREREKQQVPFIQCPHEYCKIYMPKLELESQINKGLIRTNANYSVVCCPSQGCPFIMKKYHGKGNMNKFDCPICEGSYCLQCKQPSHLGQCYSNNEKNANKNCPKCRFKVKRRNGQKWLYCRCGCKFCHDCEQIVCQCWDKDGFIGNGGGFGNLEIMRNNYYKGEYKKYK